MYSQSVTSKVPGGNDRGTERGTLSNLVKDDGSVDDDAFYPRDSNTPSITQNDQEQDTGMRATLTMENQNQIQTFGITPKTLDVAIYK